MSYKKQYAEWREQQVKTVGRQTQMKAEAMLDSQASQDFVEVNDDKSGTRKHYRKHIADILEQRGEVTRPKKYFFMS